MRINHSKNRAFTDLFIKHIKQFIADFGLFNKSETLYIACSGGIDSMVLVHVIYQLKRFGYSNNLVLLHINHGTRKENFFEQSMVEAFALKLGVECIVERFSGLKELSNFEKVARDLRYKSFKKSALGSKILLGHHIDDSFEWSLMQSFSSSNLSSALGIPVVNANIVRPLMCVTKEQIQRYAKYFSIPYLNDPTNELMGYDRNFVRNKIVSEIKEKYPAYLKHYVNSKNELAYKLGCHVQKAITKFTVKKLKDCVELYSLDEFKASDLKLKLRDAVHVLSDNNRGQIQKQLKNVEVALQNNKLGPISFSGGVMAYLSFNHIFLTSRGYNLKEGDHLIKELSFKHSYLQFNIKQFKLLVLKLLESNDENLAFPLWVVVSKKKSKWLPGQKRIHPLWPKLTKYWLDNDVKFISAIALLRHWEKKSHSTKALRIRFLSSVKLDLYT